MSSSSGCSSTNGITDNSLVDATAFFFAAALVGGAAGGGVGVGAAAGGGDSTGDVAGSSVAFIDCCVVTSAPSAAFADFDAGSSAAESDDDVFF